MSLKGIDPVRYALLTHPDEVSSYDMYSQALQAIKHPVGLCPLGRHRAGVVIAGAFK